MKKPKRVLTQEEKDAAKIRELKKLALLKEPKGEPGNAWLLYTARNQRSRPGTDEQKNVVRDYHNLSATEMSVSGPYPSRLAHIATAISLSTWYDYVLMEVYRIFKLRQRPTRRPTRASCWSGSSPTPRSASPSPTKLAAL